MPLRRGLGAALRARRGLGAGARARRLAAGSWTGRAVSFLAAEAEPPPEHGKWMFDQLLLGLCGELRGLSRWVPVPRNAVAALAAVAGLLMLVGARGGAVLGCCCSSRSLCGNITPAKIHVSRRLFRGVGAGRRS